MGRYFKVGFATGFLCGVGYFIWADIIGFQIAWGGAIFAAILIGALFGLTGWAFDPDNPIH